jgi:hemerythrin
MYISWQKRYETGHPLIDAQHKLLVFLFKRLDAAIKTSQPAARLSRIVLETRRFVEFHFISEENLMEETGFHGLDAHRQMHAELLLEMNTMIAKVTAQREYPEDLLYFLNKWLIDHIGVHDQGAAFHAMRSSERPVAEVFYLEYFPAVSSSLN